MKCDDLRHVLQRREAAGLRQALRLLNIRDPDFSNKPRNC